MTFLYSYRVTCW